MRTFWALAAGFAICGATTNGLIGTHFIPSAHDHGMPETTAAGLLAVVGIFDIVGTIASGWLTDRYNPRILLAVYYQFRGIGLLVLPLLLSATVQPSMIVFVVIYGLDWVATVPPTAAICRQVFGADGSVVFGWVFAAHQLGAAAAALAPEPSATPPASTPTPGSAPPRCAPSPRSSAPPSARTPRGRTSPPARRERRR